MAKYSYEFKEKIVKEYLAGGGSYRFLSEKYEIPSKNSLMMWVDSYRTYGSDGLLGGDNQKGYTFDFKRRMVELYLTTDISYWELALSVGMKTPISIQKWVKIARIAGIDALNPKAKGSDSKMAKPKDSSAPKGKKDITDTEHLKQLEAENLQLRIENAYLKEQRRLRLKETHQKKKRESSTASEENSD